MTFRRSLGVAALMLAAAAAVPAVAQTPPPARSNTSAQNSAAQTAGKQVNQIRLDMNKVQGDMSRIRLKVRNEILGKPEWANVVAAKKAAETNVDAARRTVLSTLRTKDEYKNLVKERDDASATVSASNAPNSQVSDDDAKKAGDTLVKDGFAIKKMEMDALKEDPKYSEASAELDSVNAKMKELDSAVDLALKDDKDYQADDQKLAQLKTSLASAQAQLAQARKSEEEARINAQKSSSGSSGGGTYH